MQSWIINLIEKYFMTLVLLGLAFIFVLTLIFTNLVTTIHYVNNGYHQEFTDSVWQWRK